MYSTAEFRNGLKILLDNTPYEIAYFQHVKPGKGGAFVRTKLKNLKNGSVLEKTFRAGEKVGIPDIEQVEMQYLYGDEVYHFMNTQSFEQIEVDPKRLGDARLFLRENEKVSVMFFNGDVLRIELPPFIVLTITHCEPGLRGDTVSGATKPATLETGATVQVPLFVNQGDKVKVDTRTGEYVERA